MGVASKEKTAKHEAPLWVKKLLPSNAHISTPFFQKTVFSLKYVLVAPLKIFGGLSKIGIYLILKSSVQF
jgi:hypothetical protein